MQKTQYFARLLLFDIVLVTTFCSVRGTTSENKMIGRDSSGRCDNFLWTFNEGTHTLSINGTGEVKVRSCFSNLLKSLNSIRFIVFEEGITSIDDDSFRDLTDLQNISFPMTLTSIGERSFSKCNSLTNVFIPSNLTAIGLRAFSNCLHLTSFIVSDENPQYMSKDGILLNKEGIILIKYPCGKSKIFTIENVTSIYKDAFYQCDNLINVTISPGVKSIGDYAFANCRNLSSVELPSSITRISQGAFGNDVSLTSFTIPPNVDTIDPLCFGGCTNLKSLTIPASVTMIWDSAFVGCSSLYCLNYLGKKCPQFMRTVVGSVLDFAMVPLDYYSDLFLIFPVCKASSYENLIVQNNHCFRVTNCSDDNLPNEKREKAILWENKTDGCFEYVCDNESGYLFHDRCVNNGKNGICMDGKCVESEEIPDDEWKIEIEFMNVNLSTYNSIELLKVSSNESGVGMDEMKLVTETDDNGNVLRIFVLVNEAQKAETIKTSLNKYLNETDCNTSFMCQDNIAGIATIPGVKGLDFLDETQSVHNIIPFFFVIYLLLFFL